MPPAEHPERWGGSSSRRCFPESILTQRQGQAEGRAPGEQTCPFPAQKGGWKEPQDPPVCSPRGISLLHVVMGSSLSLPLPGLNTSPPLHAPHKTRSPDLTSASVLSAGLPPINPHFSRKAAFRTGQKTPAELPSGAESLPCL